MLQPHREWVYDRSWGQKQTYGTGRSMFLSPQVAHHLLWQRQCASALAPKAPHLSCHAAAEQQVLLSTKENTTMTGSRDRHLLILFQSVVQGCVAMLGGVNR